MFDTNNDYCIDRWELYHAYYDNRNSKFAKFGALLSRSSSRGASRGDSFTDMVDAEFEFIDTNGNGCISFAELRYNFIVYNGADMTDE